MAAKIKKTLKREIRIHGIKAPVIVAMTEVGIEMSLPGFKTKLSSSWGRVADSLSTPMNVPSFLAGKPTEFLKNQETKWLAKHADGEEK